MANTLRFYVLAFVAALCVTLLGMTVSPTVASAAEVVIDDFNDGNIDGWGFFGGNAAGGGGGPLDDRPQEGPWYFSTGWGGEGTGSAFYGGTFRNFDDGAQIVPPVDPVFNVWVYNQSDATVDAYNLELTLREDLDGNGWTDGAEDSVQTVVSIESCQFNDEWTLISVPLSEFNSLGTGGNDSFDGNLDEIVIVIGGVQGGSGSTVEVDFDRFFFSDGGVPLGDGYAPCTGEDATVVFDDMEHGDPGGNGWFAFNGNGGGGIGPDTDVPPVNGGSFSLGTGWGSGGVPGFYGGFGRTSPTDTGASTVFRFWINPEAGQDYTLEINLQDDDNGDNAIASPNEGADDEFQYNCVVSPSGPCAISGGGWQLVTIPLEDFFDDNSFLDGGNGVLDLISADNGGNGQLINVVWAVIGNSGSDVNFRTDYWVFDRLKVIDDFENGLPMGSDPASLPVGFYTFSGGGPVGLATTDAPPAPRPGAPDVNNVLAMTVDVASFGGFIHAFENQAVDTWVSQDWSGYEGLRVWVYGLNTGTQMFIDVLDNRGAGSTTDDAERYTVSFPDDFSGWKQFVFPFETFERKEIGNGAPNDGFTLTEVHGWALGTLDTGGERTWYVDQAELYGQAEIPELVLSFSAGGYGFEEGTTGEIGVKLNRALNDDDPDQVTVDYATSPGTAVPDKDYIDTSGTLTFFKGGPSEQTFSVETIDDSKWQGGRSFLVTLSNPIGAPISSAQVVSAFVVDNDEFDPQLQDDFETPPFLWDSSGNVNLSSEIIEAGDPGARPGQDAMEGVLNVDGPLLIEAQLMNKWCKVTGRFQRAGRQVQVAILTTDTFDALDVDHTTVTFGDASERHVDKKTGLARRHEDDVDGDGDTDLIFHFLTEEVNLDCEAEDLALNGRTFDGQAVTADRSEARVQFGRDFPIGNDWSDGESLSFWYYGSGSGAEVKVTLKDNRAPDPGPSGWSLVWAEEFDEPAGTQPNPDNWSFEIGDGTVNGIPGWGNGEFQYYTDDPANASTDGSGNLLITLDEADGSLLCYYGPCEYTSARLISQRKAEFAYGRIESRILVPDGGDGLWPAFWSLGTDIGLVGWPQTGEIDFMEYVSRIPNEIFGTVHGPGYSGGGSFAGIRDFGEPVYNDYHTFAVEWEPDLIVWYVDGIEYHRATPADVPGPWVFNDPVFLLLNMAVGGNFGGAIDPNLELPQTMAVDYVRVFQGPDTAERFEASFVDDVAGWQQVQVPFSDFVRSAEQPQGAPDDGLGLTEVWGYGFELPEGGSARLDEVRLELPPPTLEVIVTNLDDSGPGSLRQALSTIGGDGIISFDPGLADGTLMLTSGQLVADRSVTIDGSTAPGLRLSGNNASRVLQVDGGATVSINDLVVTEGAGSPQGGGILNFGTLNLDRVAVTGNVQTAAGPPNFALGGGGIYNGEGATLNLTDSSVSDNTSINQPGGGIFGFFGSTINITRSTISGNFSGDVAGGLRSLGNSTVLNSTFSGNVSAAWHGGGIFHTDGQLTVTNSTFAENTAPPGTASGILVATFGAPANMTLTNTIVEGNNGAFACAIEGGGAATITSGGGNIDNDGSCNLTEPSDQAFTDADLEPLADYGGPTLTHALMPGSPAIDAAEAGPCPAIDQRGVARDAACDVGAYEVDAD